MSQDPRKREEAAEALGETRRPEAVELLSMALEDADEDVREAAVDALAEIGGDTAIGLLQKALADQDESIRETAADILAELTAPRRRGQRSTRKGARYPHE